MHFRSLRLFRILAGGALALAADSTGGLASTPPDKGGHHLFAPTPRELLREMSTDRPDKTESPYTVDAGWMQVETDLASFTCDRHNAERSDRRVESWSFGTANVKFGLWHNVDFQIVLEPYTTARVVEQGRESRQQGFGDLTLRTKVNLWGNDGGPSALALMPFVKLPANEDGLGNHAVEGGLIVPLALELPGEFGLGLMTELDVLEDEDGSGCHAEWVNTVTVGHALTDQLGAYLEFSSIVSHERHVPWVGTLDVGLTFALNDDVQLDCGINVGLTRSADDLNPFVGLSWRF